MKKFTKVLFVALVLAFIPLKQWAQTPYRLYSNDGILLNAFEIDNVDFRIFLFFNLNQDEQFEILVNEEPGQFSIVPGHHGEVVNLFDAFESAYQRAYTDFGFLSKMDITELLLSWKCNIPAIQFSSLTLDIALRNNRPSNNHCVDSDPFCTSDVITFDAATSTETADQLEGTTINDGCIGSSYSPAWYHMRINDPGQFIIHMEGHDPTSGTNRDIDFCMWGPYTDPTSPCVAQLTTDKIIDCSFSAAYFEDIFLGYNDGDHYHGSSGTTSHGTIYYHLPQTGEYYILMITNFSRQPCTISFTKTENSGPGTTDCGILPGIVSNDGPYCVGETIHLTVNQQVGATYSWTGPGGFTSNQLTPTRPNCTLAMAGTYTCTTTVGAQTTTASTRVVIYAQPHASFNATSVCVGQATQFTSTSTTTPSGQSIGSYQWNFGDGQTGTGQSTSHTYANAGTYQVTLTVSTGNGHCTDQVTQTVTVNAEPTASFTATTVCQGDPTQFTSTSSGNQINGYQWNFGDGQTGNGQTVSHSYAQPGTYNVTHIIQTAGGCSDQVTQTVTVNATPVASASATPSTILYGASTTLTADPGTQGTFNFHWEPANMVVNPNAQTTQTVVLQQSQTYTVTITNPQGNCTSTAQVIVSIDGSSLIAMATADQTDLCEGESTTLHAIPSGGAPENYSFQWSPAGSLNSTTSQNPVATPGLGNTTYTCHVTDGFTDVNVSVTIHVHPNVEHDIYQTICENDTYSYFGEDIHTPGVYDHTLYTQYGCDSVLHLHLDNWQIYETNVSDRFCQNDTYQFYDQDITTPGIYFHTLQSIHGCDSTIRLNLSQDPVYEFEMWESTCEGGPGFNYNGTYLQPRPEPYSFPYETVNHCDSIVILHIEEAAYNSKNYNVSICGTEYTWVSNGVTYYETGVYRDTLHFPGMCDSTVVLNLELRPNYYDDVVVSSCDEYRWIDDNFNVDRTFTESTVYTHHYTNVYGCESEATLHLTINDHDEYAFVVPEDEACDEYFWDPNGHEITYTDHAGDLYTMTGVYHRTYLNQAECDSIVTMRVNMEYTPHPTPIYPMDLDNTAPHWVVTATEFQINTYDFNLWDTNPLCHWDTVTWQCVGAPDWIIEPFGAKAKCCKVYVLNHVNDTIWLTAHAFNRCAPDEGITQRYWMVCSFYGVDENIANVDFSVIPNPNNGQMTLNFENLTGKIKVKVYDMKGAILDDFETYNTMNSYAYTYQMKNRVDGIYFIVVTGKEGTVAKKVILKR
jgi:PKD repeat protein